MTISELIARRKAGFSLEQPFYTSDDILRLEFERIFSRRWLFAGPAMLIPNPGDYFLVSVLDESIIVVRGDDGVVRAHFNVCRHRGSHICLEPHGRVKQLVCPYHAWVYGLDGKLLSARLTPDDFEKANYNLDAVHVREEQGLLFICLAEQPRDSFDATAAAMREVFGPYDLPRAKIAKHIRYDVKANWKLLRENFWECYHCVPNHPEYCSKVPSAPAAGLPDKQRRNQQRAEQLHEKWRARGLTIASHYSGDDDPWWRCGNGGALEDGAVSNSLDGKPVAPVMGTLPDDYTGYAGMAMPQCFTLEASRDHVVVLRLLPTSPTATAVDIWWLVRGDAVEGRDYDPDNVAAMWKITAEQDWTICESSQAGVKSSRYRPGPYAPVEVGTETFVRWVVNQLRD
jgi:Rieske 2Fe-2S family protein